MSDVTAVLRAQIRDGDDARRIPPTIHCTCSELRKAEIVRNNEHGPNCRWRWAIDEIYARERAEEGA